MSSGPATPNRKLDLATPGQPTGARPKDSHFWHSSDPAEVLQAQKVEARIKAGPKTVPEPPYLTPQARSKTPDDINQRQERFIEVNVTDKQIPSGSGLRPRDVALMSEEEQVEHTKRQSLADMHPGSAPDSPPLSTQEMRENDLLVMCRIGNRQQYNRDTDKYDNPGTDSDTLLTNTEIGTAGTGNWDIPPGPPEPAGASTNPIIVENHKDGSNIHPIDSRKRAISVSPELSNPKKASRKGDIPTPGGPTGKNKPKGPTAQQTRKEPTVRRETGSHSNQAPTPSLPDKTTKQQATGTGKVQPAASKQPQATSMRREAKPPNENQTRPPIKKTNNDNTNANNRNAPQQQRMQADGARNGSNDTRRTAGPNGSNSDANIQRRNTKRKGPAYYIPTHNFGFANPMVLVDQIRFFQPKLNNTNGAVHMTLKRLHSGAAILIPTTDRINSIMKTPIRIAHNRTIELPHMGEHKRETYKYKVYGIPGHIKPQDFAADSKVLRCAALSGNRPHSRPGTWVALLSCSEPMNDITAKNKHFRMSPDAKTPRRCTKCQTFGHVQAICRATDSKCAFCASAHASDICYTKITKGESVSIKCANCGGPHKATAHHCPEFIRACDAITPHKEAPPPRHNAWRDPPHR